MPLYFSYPAGALKSALLGYFDDVSLLEVAELCFDEFLIEDALLLFDDEFLLDIAELGSLV